MSRNELSFRRKPQGAKPEQPSGGPPIVTVSQVVHGANRILELRFPRLCIEGEVSNLSIATAGHAYFTLRDAASTLQVAMWRSAVEKLKFTLANGQSLHVFGRLGVFAKSGRFQLYGDRAEPAGLGALMLELAQRKARLTEQGLFLAERKRALPRFPRRIGVVTSATGAAIHDILKVARRRCPSAVLLSPALVQGPDAPRQLCRALARLDRFGVDVIIIGRGGGSMEDLWAFNDEELVHAIARCSVPVVSAVGHEVDTSLSDLVADVRAATPSHAAELVVPDLAAWQEAFSVALARLERRFERDMLDQRGRHDALVARLGGCGPALVVAPRSQLRKLERRLHAVHPRAAVAGDRRSLASLIARLDAHGRSLVRTPRAQLAAARTRLITVGSGLGATARRRLRTLEARLQAQAPVLSQGARIRLATAASALQALSPLRVLERGYAVVTDASGRALVASEDAEVGTNIAIRLHGGTLRARVTEVEVPNPPASEEES